MYSCEEQSKRFQVVIVNALPKQYEIIKKAFPELDIRRVHGRVPGEQNPDIVISLVGFIRHPLDRMLRRKYGSKYEPVNGTCESIKLAIRRRLRSNQCVVSP